MDRAREDLRVAQVDLAAQAYDATLNRAYYAAFHATRALLGSRGLVTRKHSGVLSLFDLHFVKSGEVDARLGRVLHDLCDLRTTADYEDLTHTSEEQARQAVNDAREFVGLVEDLLGLEDEKAQAEP